MLKILLIVVLVSVCVYILWQRRRRTRELVLADRAIQQRQPQVQIPQAAHALQLPLLAGATSGWSGAGIPLCTANRRIVGIPYGEDSGHVIVIAPTRSGKGLHATDVLLAWPGAAVVVDPKAEQWRRTAGARVEAVGPVYAVPGAALDLLDYYNLHDPLDSAELFSHLLTPWKDKDPVFINKMRPLLDAAVKVGQATGEHPLRLLASWTQQAPGTALHAAATHAPQTTELLTDGTPLDALGGNRFFMSSWGTFTSRFAPLAPFVPMFSESQIPKDWAGGRASLYLTFPLYQMEAAAPLIAATLAALIRGQMQRAGRTPVLLLVDEMPTVALHNLVEYLATMGGSGLTALLYAQSLTQIDSVYGRDRARAILGNCTHQLFYPPRDMETARYVSEAVGREWQQHRTVSRYPDRQGGHATGSRGPVPYPAGSVGYSYSEQQRARLEPDQVMKLPETAVVCFSRQQGQAVTFVGQRLDSRQRFAILPSAPPQALRHLPVPDMPQPVSAPPQGGQPPVVPLMPPPAATANAGTTSNETFF